MDRIDKACGCEGRHWIRERPIYQIMLKDYAPRFGSGSTFEYITSDLDRLCQAGIGTLWLTGLAKNENGTTPFSVLDPRAVEKSYGTERALKKLLKAAHECGLKVIIDFIPNHVSRLSEICQIHPNWFLKDADGRIVSATDRRGSWEWQGLAQFDFLNPDLIEYLMGTGRHWLKFGFDGFRLDAPLAMVKERMVENWYADCPEAVERAFPEEFWRVFTRGMAKINPDVGFLAESFGGYRELLMDCGIHLTLDAGFSYILYEVMREDALPKKLIDYLLSSLDAQKNLVHYKDGHDIRDVNFQGQGMEKLRYLDTAELRNTALLLAVLPGVPMYYNGEIEAILGYPYYHDSAHPIPWHFYNPEMKAFYGQLLALTARPVFRQGLCKIPGIKKSGSPNILCLTRECGNEKILVAADLRKLSAEKETQWIFPDIGSWIIDGNFRYGIKDIFHNRIYPAYSGQDIKRYGLPIGLAPGEIQILQITPE